MAEQTQVPEPPTPPAKRIISEDIKMPVTSVEKPGYKTTEFWITVAIGVVSLGIATGTIDVAVIDKITTAITTITDPAAADPSANNMFNAISKLASLGVGGYVSSRYIKSRTDTKINATKNQG